MIPSRSYSFFKLIFITLIALATAILVYQLQYPKSDKAISEDLNLLLEELNNDLIAEWDLARLDETLDHSPLLKSTKILEYKNDSLIRWKEAELKHYLQESNKLNTGALESVLNPGLLYFFEINLNLQTIRNPHVLDIAKTKWSYQIVEYSNYFINNETDGQKIYLEIQSRNIGKFWRTLKYLLFFIGFLGLSIVAYRSYFESINYKKRFFSSFLFGVGFLGPGLLAYLTKPDLILCETPWYFLYYGILSLSLVGFISKLVGFKVSSNNKFDFLSATLLLGISLSITALLLGTDYIIKANLLNINFEGVFYSPLSGIISLAGIMLSLVGIFLIHFKIYNLINQSFVNKAILKWILVSISILITSAFAYFLIPGINPALMGISMLIYLLVLDMFVDARSFNISWIILWLFLISSFYTLVLFSLKTYNDKETINKILENSIGASDEKLVLDLIDLRSAIDQDKLNALATIAYPFQMSKSDITSYFSNGTKPDLLLEYFCFDKDGNSMIRDEYWKSAAFRYSLRYQKKISDSISYNPISGDHFTRYKIINQSHPGSPFSLFITTNDQSKLSQRLSNLENIAIQDSENASPKLIDANLVAGLKSGFSEIEVKSQNYQVYKKSDGTLAYHRRPVFDLIKPVSLFSYIFVSLGILLTLVSSFDSLIDFLPSAFKYSINQSSLRNRIQVNIVLLIVVSFIIIGIVTVFYFQRVSKDHSISNIKTNLQTLSSNIELQLDDVDDQGRAQRILQDKLADYASFYQAHLVQYDQFGNMVNATLPGMTNKKVAYDWISNLNVDDELYLPEYAKVQNKDFISGSALIKTPKIGLVGFVQLINQEQQTSVTNVNDFLGTLLNVYVFLFLIAGALALAVSNSITYPIAVIGDKMRQFKLGKKNEKLEWNKKDELGALIDEYNQMIVKLEESADFIAKTERDFAWREMAKQVAHEIKNPLTPMKLSIQYMQKAIDAHPDRAKELIDNVSSTLIEQINNLSQIANEFSNFAKIPEAKNEKVVINEVVETVHDLFRKRDDMEILLSEPIDEIHVHADKNHLIRILNNLVKNAIQAIPQNRHGRIELFLYIENQNAIIKVSDNGTGIPKEMEERVFVPNFTTKSSGTGLGLAISANMAESFNGRIYFETVVDKGTDFFIEIPLLRSIISQNDTNRISLD